MVASEIDIATGKQLLYLLYFITIGIAGYFVKLWVDDIRRSISNLYDRVNGCPSKDDCKDNRAEIIASLVEDLERAEDIARRHRHDENGDVIPRW